MADPKFMIQLGAFRFVKPSNARLVLLFKSTAATSTVSLEEAGVDYQVPVGKKFKALLARCYWAGAVGTQQLFQADNADGTTNAVNKDRTVHNDASLEQNLSGFEIVAQKYLNVTPSTSTALFFLVIGIELDA